MSKFPDELNFFDSTDALILRELADAVYGVLEVSGKTKPRKTMDDEIYEKYGVTRDDPRYRGYMMGMTNKNAFFDWSSLIDIKNMVKVPLVYFFYHFKHINKYIY